MLKKTMMMAVAVAAVAAFTAPGMATAGLWKHHDQSVQENEEIVLTGQTKWTGGLTGEIECQVTTTLALEAGQSTGTLTQYEVDLDAGGSTVTNKCNANGLLANCQLHTLEAKNLPWTIHNETQSIEVTSGEIHYTMTGGFCPAKRVTMTVADPENGHTITFTPNQVETFTSFEESGEMEIHSYSQHSGGSPFRTGTATTQGSLTVVSEEDKHTYSLE